VRASTAVSSPPAPVIRDDVAEYAVNRTIDDERYLFLVYFLRGVDGVWRLDSM